MRAATQQIRFCPSHDGVRLAYATAGRGTPIVKAANWLNHLEFDWDSPVWRHLLAELTRDHLLIRYDERGCGLSDWSVPEFSFDAWLRDLETVVDTAGIERFALLGISQGRRSPLPTRCAIPSASPTWCCTADTRAAVHRGLQGRAIEEVDLTIRLAEIGWGQENAASASSSRRSSFQRGRRTTSLVERPRAHHDLAGERGTVSARFLRIDVRRCCRWSVARGSVLHPTRDRSVPFDEGRLLAGSIPGARFAPLESCNHLLLETEPAWQRWCTEVRAFLPTRTPIDPVFATLTARERELVELIARGRDNAQIAAQLGLSEKTVRNHITSIFAKLQVESRAQTIVLALKAGFGVD